MENSTIFTPTEKEILDSCLPILNKQAYTIQEVNNSVRLSYIFKKICVLLEKYFGEIKIVLPKNILIKTNSFNIGYIYGTLLNYNEKLSTLKFVSKEIDIPIDIKNMSKIALENAEYDLVNNYLKLKSFVSKI